VLTHRRPGRAGITVVNSQGSVTGVEVNHFHFGSSGQQDADIAEITIPEITKVGAADSQPVNALDWFAEGFMIGFNAPRVRARTVP
jgi:hypothetical protein